MSSLATEMEATVRATSVRVTDETITVDLEDGRTISVPTEWYPRLLHATPAERERYEIDDVGVMWEQIDADFSIRGLLLGRKSGENPKIVKWWLQQRAKGCKATVEEYLRRTTRLHAAPMQRRRKAG